MVEVQMHNNLARMGLAWTVTFACVWTMVNGLSGNKQMAESSLI